MIRRRLVILTAVQLEARAIARAWHLPTPKPNRPVRTDANVPSIEVHLVGIRAARMPANLRDQPLCGIIMAGLAGALDPSLAIGDVVIDDCPPGLSIEIPALRGKIVASDSLLCTPSQKLALFKKTGALAVDMESAVARELAANLAVPFVSIRAISDTADEHLDPAVLRMVDSFGHVRPTAIAATLLGRPALIPYLMRLGSASRLAAGNLSAAVAAIARAWSELG